MGDAGTTVTFFLLGSGLDVRTWLALPRGPDETGWETRWGPISVPSNQLPRLQATQAGHLLFWIWTLEMSSSTSDHNPCGRADWTKPGVIAKAALRRTVTTREKARSAHKLRPQSSAHKALLASVIPPPPAPSLRRGLPISYIVLQTWPPWVSLIPLTHLACWLLQALFHRHEPPFPSLLLGKLLSFLLSVEKPPHPENLP